MNYPYGTQHPLSRARRSTSKEAENQSNGTSLVKDQEEDKKESIVENNELTAYYAQLAEEREREAREDREADESEDDEEEFEDVDVGHLNAGTPSESSSLKVGTGTGSSQTNQKSKRSESGSSAAGTNASTPATGEIDDLEGPASKKVKFEAATKLLTIGEATTANQMDKESDEDEGVEFEDV